MAKEALNGINKFTRRGTQVEERGMKETQLGTAQRAEECKHSGTGKKGLKKKKNKKETEKTQSQREAEPAKCVKYHQLMRRQK